MVICRFDGLKKDKPIIKIKVDQMPEEKTECLFCYEDNDLCDVYIIPGVLPCMITRTECDLDNGQCSCCVKE